MLKVLHRTLEE